MVYPDSFEGFQVNSHKQWSDFKKQDFKPQPFGDRDIDIKIVGRCSWLVVIVLMLSLGRLWSLRIGWYSSLIFVIVGIPNGRSPHRDWRLGLNQTAFDSGPRGHWPRCKSWFPSQGCQGRRPSWSRSSSLVMLELQGLQK